MAHFARTKSNCASCRVWWWVIPVMAVFQKLRQEDGHKIIWVSLS